MTQSINEREDKFYLGDEYLGSVALNPTPETWSQKWEFTTPTGEKSTGITRLQAVLDGLTPDFPGADYDAVTEVKQTRPERIFEDAVFLIERSRYFGDISQRISGNPTKKNISAILRAGGRVDLSDKIANRINNSGASK